MKYSILLSLVILLLNYCAGQTNSSNPNGTDTIFVGSKMKLLFEASPDSSGHLFFNQVKKIKEAEKTVSIEVTYSEALGTMLKIANPFDRALIYNAELYSYSKKNFVATSTIPVGAKLVSFETWPFKIDKIRLTGFVLKNAE